MARTNPKPKKPTAAVQGANAAVAGAAKNAAKAQARYIAGQNVAKGKALQQKDAASRGGKYDYGDGPSSPGGYSNVPMPPASAGSRVVGPGPSGGNTFGGRTYPQGGGEPLAPDPAFFTRGPMGMGGDGQTFNPVMGGGTRVRVGGGGGAGGTRRWAGNRGYAGRNIPSKNDRVAAMGQEVMRQRAGADVAEDDPWGSGPPRGQMFRSHNQWNYMDDGVDHADLDPATQAEIRARRDNYRKSFTNELTKRQRKFDSVAEYEDFVKSVPGYDRSIGGFARDLAEATLKNLDEDQYNRLMSQREVDNRNRDSMKRFGAKWGEDPDSVERLYEMWVAGQAIPERAQNFIDEWQASPNHPTFDLDPVTGTARELPPSELSQADQVRVSYRDAEKTIEAAKDSAGRTGVGADMTIQQDPNTGLYFAGPPPEEVIGSPRWQGMSDKDREEEYKAMGKAVLQSNPDKVKELMRVSGLTAEEYLKYGGITIPPDMAIEQAPAEEAAAAGPPERGQFKHRGGSEGYVFRMGQGDGAYAFKTGKGKGEKWRFAFYDSDADDWTVSKRAWKGHKDGEPMPNPSTEEGRAQLSKLGGDGWMTAADYEKLDPDSEGPWKWEGKDVAFTWDEDKKPAA